MSGKSSFIFVFISICCISIGSDLLWAQKPIIASIDIKQERPAITKYHFGQFIENLGNKDVGNLVDDGLWAEMLDDRKFFYPVDTIALLTPVNKRDRVRQWTPVGSPEHLKMDSLNPYVGVHSPKILTESGQVSGISQAGIWVQKGKKYTGRIVLKGSSNLPVTVSLIWGNAANERVSLTINKLTSSYQKFQLAFDCKQSSTNARLEITGKGDGDFTIGAVSLMPEDNIKGFRPEVVELLKGLKSGIYRWGGNFISGYDWRDGIGDPDKRPPRYEYAWEAVESNDVSTHEMIRLAELVGVEIALTVNTGFGDAYSAGQWVEYVNGNSDTPMGKLRAANGHPAPFGVQYWCVGNESYGHWQLGHIDLKNHIIKHRMFAEKMREADPNIKLVASGAALEEMTITGSAFHETGRIVAEYDSASDWTGGMLRDNLNAIDLMSEHFYCSVNEHFDINLGKYIPVHEPLQDWTRRPANRIRAKSENYEEYFKRNPSAKKKNIKVYLDEWAYYTNWVHPTPTLGVMIGYARGLNEMFRHTDLIAMAGFTFATSCLSFNDTAAIYNNTGLLFHLYQSQLGSIPVEVSGTSPQPAPIWTIGGEQPKVNAGGSAYPLDIVATLTSDRKYLTVAVVNPTEEKHMLSLDFNGVKVAKKVGKWLLDGKGIDAKNVVGQNQQVSINQSVIVSVGSVEIEPASVAIYRYELE